MIRMLVGEAVKLWTKTQTTTDAFGAPVYTWTSKTVDNVLIGQPSDDERATELNLTGRRIEYVLGIPKGDTNDWENQIVEFFGHKFRTFGIPVMGIEANIPLSWHKQVRCERYE